MTGAPNLAATCYPFFYVFDARIANGFIGGREIIPHTGSADTDTEIGGSGLETIDITIGRQRRIPGEIIARRIESLKLVFCGELEDLHQGYTRASSLNCIVQQFVEGICVKRSLEYLPLRGGDGGGGERQ